MKNTSKTGFQGPLSQFLLKAVFVKVLHKNLAHLRLGIKLSFKIIQKMKNIEETYSEKNSEWINRYTGR